MFFENVKLYGQKRYACVKTCPTDNTTQTPSDWCLPNKQATNCSSWKFYATKRLKLVGLCIPSELSVEEFTGNRLDINSYIESL